MEFDIGTIKHLGLQMYSTLPPVIGELISNAWDADATKVEIEIPLTALNDNSEITIRDNGSGMSDSDVRDAYLIVGRDRREAIGKDSSDGGRKVMGRKGIGKLSAFGIAGQIEIETVSGSENSHFIMDYESLQKQANRRVLEMPSLPATGKVDRGTLITLKQFNKFRTRAINIIELRRGLARRFSIIGIQNNFSVYINGVEITPEERDLQRLLEVDSNGQKYIWVYDDVDISNGSDLKVSGWIGALDRTSKLEDGIQRGIVIMARGKMVQEPFVFDALVGQQFALSYLVGELYAEFVDTEEDTVGTTRNSLVWDTQANTLLLEWGQHEVNKVAREWSNKRQAENEKLLQENTVYKKFIEETNRISSSRFVKKLADGLIRKAITENPLQDPKQSEEVIQTCIDFMEYDSFKELATELNDTKDYDIKQLVKLFREFEVLEAKEMMRVTEQRIRTIERLQKLIDNNALEVPALHNFLKEFPWVIDPRWTLVADEVRYSKLLRTQFPEEIDTLEIDKRIDFLCVKESNNLVVVEIKRPQSKLSSKELDQIEEYVLFMRDYCSKTTDPEMKSKEVFGYILGGSLVDTYQVRGRSQNLEKAGIFVRKYTDLLMMVENIHKDFLIRYNSLKALREHQLKSPDNFLHYT
jgi:hypothetical protein